MLFMLDVVANHVGKSRRPSFDEQSVVSIRSHMQRPSQLGSYDCLRYRSDPLCRSAAAAWPRAEFSEGRTDPHACTKTKRDVATVGTPKTFVDLQCLRICGLKRDARGWRLNLDLFDLHVQRYIDNPVDMTVAGLPPFGSNATGVCWPNYVFGGAD